MQMIKDMEKIVDEYLGIVILCDNKKIITLQTSTWNIEERNVYETTLVGIISFIKWKIPCSSAFKQCKKLKYILGVAPLLGNDISSMFYEALEFNSDISHWDTSNITNMWSAFYKAKKFNQDIGKWTVNKVYIMLYMFCGACSFNQDLSEWDVKNLSSCHMIFHGSGIKNIPRWYYKQTNNNK